MTGSIRHKIFRMMLITIVLIIAAYTAVFFYQTSRAERLVDETYEAQKQIYIDNGLEDQYEAFRSNDLVVFRNEMFHARNVLTLLVVLIVGAGMASAYSITKRIIDPLNTITRRVASLGVRNRQFVLEDIYKTGDEIEVLAESFAKQSARTRLYIDQIKRVTAEKERIGAELDMASRIQASQLPRTFPPFPDRKEFGLYASMTPAKEVGGDFYDLFMIDDDHIGLVMADVSGKGVPAALFMVIAKTLIKNQAQLGKNPAEVLKNVNEQLCEGNEAELFVTVWLAVIQISTGKGIAANAGHEHPVIRRADGKYELVVYRHSPAVATMEGIRFREHSFELHPGDSLFVYTDGVPEATNARNEFFGTDRMLEAMNRDRSAQPRQLLANVRDGIEAFVGSAPQFDDITMMCFDYFGPEGNGQQLTLDAADENLNAVLAFVDEKLRELGCPPKAQMQIDVAVEEIFVNIAHYAYAPGTGPAIVRVESQPDPKKAIITFLDRGVPYDPLAKPDPDVTLPAEERQIGGLGIFITKKTMDDMLYEYRDGQNILTIIKTLEEEEN